MDTPIFDFVQRYAASDISRLHMPGHKGHGTLGCEPYDITEIQGADALYEAGGIIAQSEQNATTLFGSARTFYSTEGSSQCIRAMIFLAVMRAKRHGNSTRILAARNVHKAFIYGCALVDAPVEWLYDNQSASLCSCLITPQRLREALQRAARPPAAVYVTSPDYLGQQQDLSALSAVCEEYHVPLLVDNAHGAYLHFLPVPQHPMDLGVSLCCDSAHKTLPVLTGGAYLHVGHGFPEWEQEARHALALFGSTSPSYLILQSLDLCNRILSENYQDRLQGCLSWLDALRRQLNAAGCVLRDSEPLKLVIDATRMGYDGREIAQKLREAQVECEFTDDSQVVLMATPETMETDLARIGQALCCLPRRERLSSVPVSLQPNETRLTLREAVFAPHETVPLSAALGRICGSPTVACPPAVPIAVSGEVITAEQIALFARFGLREVEVVTCGS